MTTYFVSRHPGACQWAWEEGLAVDHQVSHLDPAALAPGDRVIGTLPVHLAAAVCAAGAHYLHLELDVPPEWRGRELSAEELRACDARLRGYRVVRDAHASGPG